MASFDVDSFFPNIPNKYLYETINIIIEKMFSENESMITSTKASLNAC